MFKYRTISRLVDAVQWEPNASMESAGRVAVWLQLHHVDFTVNADHSLRLMHQKGEHIAREGDWIIHGDGDEFYVCPGYLFGSIYESAYND